MVKLKGPFTIRLEISGPEGISRWEDVMLPYISGPDVTEDHNWDANINRLKHKLAEQMAHEFKND